MPRRWIASTLGAIIWAPVLLLIGFYFGSFIDGIPWLMPAVLIGMIVLLVVGTGLGIWQYRKEMARPEETIEVEEVVE